MLILKVFEMGLELHLHCLREVVKLGKDNLGSDGGILELCLRTLRGFG